jgi:hypothetical protein
MQVPLNAQIRLLLSAALTDVRYDLRKQQYLENFEQLAKFGYGYEDVYVVEALKKQGPTFLEEYARHVFYATVNDPKVKNQGINEAKTLLEGCYHFNFDPEDMIVKMTGRHHFISDYFLQIVQKNTDYDAILKVNGTSVFTLAFAMKYKYFKEMFERANYRAMEGRWIILETVVGEYIQQKIKQANFKVLYIDKLDIHVTFDGSSTAPHMTGVVVW